MEQHCLEVQFLSLFFSTKPSVRPSVRRVVITPAAYRDRMLDLVCQDPNK